MHLILAGLSNVYSTHVANLEEYQLQRYENAITTFGPNTRILYLNRYELLAQAFVFFDSAPFGRQSLRLPYSSQITFNFSK